MLGERRMELVNRIERVLDERVRPQLALHQGDIELVDCDGEGVLRVRGFEDAVVTVHADSANVLVRTPSLSRDQSAQILELVSRETGLLGGNIKIIPIN